MEYLESKAFDRHLERRPNFTMAVRDALTSKVASSESEKRDSKRVEKALKTYKSKAKKKLIEKFREIRSNVERYEDVIPAVIEYIDFIEEFNKDK